MDQLRLVEREGATAGTDPAHRPEASRIPMMNLDFELLRTFVAVTQTQSFAAAGELRNLGQSTVSLQIRRLEQKLGQRVFKRSRRTVELTRHGEVLLGFARRMLDLNDESVRILTAGSASGRVRLGVSEYFFPQFLPQVIARFARAYPHLIIDVRTGLTSRLRELQAVGELDVVIGRRDAPKVGRLMFREPMCWAGRRGTQLEPSEPVPLVCLPEPCGYRQSAIRALTDSGRSWRATYTASGLLGVQAAIAAGMGVGCLPLSTVQRTMRILGPKEGLPALPDSEMVLHESAAMLDVGAVRLVDIIRESLPKFSAQAMTETREFAEAA